MTLKKYLSLFSGHAVRPTGGNILCVLALVCCVSCQSRQASYEQSQASGEVQAASAHAEQMAREHERGVDRVLWQLEAGLSAFWLGHHEQSRQYFERAESMMLALDQRATVSLRSVGSKISSFFWNETLIPYRGSASDRILMHTYQALNEWRLGDVDRAKVCLRKARVERQAWMEKHRDDVKRAKTKVGDLEKGTKSKASDTSSAEVLGSLRSQVSEVYGGDENLEAYRDFTNPLNVMVEGLLFYRKGSDTGEREHGRRLLATLVKMMAWDDKMLGRLLDDKSSIVLTEKGVAPQRINQSITIPLVLGGRLTHLQVAFPLLHAPPVGTPSRSWLSRDATSLLDMRVLQQTELKERLPVLLMSQVGSMTLKAVAENRLAKENPWLGLGLGILNTLSNRADTRSWRSCPRQVWLRVLDESKEPMPRAWPRVNHPLMGSTSPERSEHLNSSSSRLLLVKDRPQSEPLVMDFDF